MRKEQSRAYLRYMFVVLILALVAGPSTADVAADYQRGLELSRTGDYPQAVQIFSSVAASNSEWAIKAQYQLGLAHFYRLMLDDAMEAFQKALAMAKPGETALVADIKINLAQSYAEAGLWDKALLLIDEISARNPEAVGRLLMDHYTHRKNYERAAAAIVYTCVETDGVDHIGSDGVPAWLMPTSDGARAKTYLDGFCEKVLAGAQLIVTPVLRKDLQGFLETTGRGAAAVKLLAGTISATSDPMDVYELASAQFRARMYQEAISTLEGLLVSGATLSDSCQASVKYRLGLSYWKLDNAQLARYYMQAVVDYHPDSSSAQRAKDHLLSWSRLAEKTTSEKGNTK